MRKSYSKYLYVRQYLKELNISFKQSFLPLVLSFLVALLLFSGPIAICINLLIFNDYMRLVAGIMGLLISFVLTLSKILFYNFILKDNKVEGIKYYYLYDGLISAVIMVLVFVLLF